MGSRRDPDWLRTLDDVEQAVRGCLATLEKYEARFEHLLQDADPGAARVREPALPVADGGDLFVERLTTARGTIDPVEQLLAEQEAIWKQWQHTLAVWRQSLEQRTRAAT